MPLLYQLDSNVIGTMFSDTGKTTQITDGGAVAAWTAPNGSVTTDCLQSTLANRPLYRANYSSSGYPAVEFDGSNDAMSIVHSAAWNVSIIDVFLVLTSTSLASGTYRGIVGKWTTNGWNDGWGISYSLGNFSIGAPAYSNVVCKAQINSRILIHCHFENGCNGCEQGNVYGGGLTGTGPQNNSGPVLLGRGDSYDAFHYKGAINEMRVYSGGESDATIVAVKNALRSKWGLSAVASGGFSMSQLVNMGG